MGNWKDCKNLLCIRLDNMGDLLMSAPAIASLKDTFKCKITVLTSSMAAPIASHIPAIDDVMVFDVPWVKTEFESDNEGVMNIAEAIRARNFDGAVIFNVYSQNPFGAIFISWLARIPLRAAYSRENLYSMLTHWLPDPEPYSVIRHQVKRDLDLVKYLGAFTYDKTIPLRIEPERWDNVFSKLKSLGLNAERPWLILHPGVSEQKREFRREKWIEVGRKIVRELNHQVLVTGGAKDSELASSIATGIGGKAINIAGKLTLAEFILLIHQTPLVISVNTVTIHIASGTNTKVIALYALTNPQHTPWKTIGKLFPYSVNESHRSKNEIIRFVAEKYFPDNVPLPSADNIVKAAFELLTDTKLAMIPELVITNQTTAV
jgi:ADP-heptose:LPS heptosyltransferase